MEQIPREFIQQLLERVEIVDLIDARVPLRKKSGNNYFACCPFHNEKSASFSVSQNKQFYHCFGCGAHGNAIDFLMNHEHLTFPETIESLAKLTGMEIPREKKSAHKSISHQSLYDLLTQITQFYQTQLRQSPIAIQYLKKRGISGEIAKEFCLGYAPPGWDNIRQTFGNATTLQPLLDCGMLIKKEEGGYYDRFRERIMFPIHDKRGRIIGFGGRILETGEPKYLNSPETPVFQKGHELYGLYYALRANRQLTRVIIVEGYMDVIALFQQGITYAVATMGTATTANHLQRLFRHTSEIIFCFDGDQAGRTAGWRALQQVFPLMRDGIQVRFLFLPDGEDPDSLIRKESKEQFEQRIQQAVSLSHFFFQALANQTDLTHMDGRARYVKLANDFIHQLPDSFFKKMMQEELSKKAGIHLDSLQPRAHTKTLNPVLTKAKPPSPLRLAMMLLVQYPELAQCYHEPLPQLELKGFDLFCELFNLAKQHRLTTGSILEHWRGREEEKLIVKLAQLEHMIPQGGVENEFLGALKQLNKLAQTLIIERLLAKASQQELSSEEKSHLNQLISTKIV